MAPQREPDAPRWLLRRADQAAVGSLIALALVAMAGWWLVQGGWRGRLIELDRLPQRTAEFKVDVNAADWSTRHLCNFETYDTLCEP